MIKIAVCDDDIIMTEFIGEAVLSEYFKYDNEVIVDNVDNHAILQITNNHYDIIFLDIDMPDISGFDIAEKLNSNSGDTLIIFVTSHDELVYSSIKFKPFRFIRKTYLESELPEAAAASVAAIHNIRNSEKLIFRTKNGEVITPLKKIVFLEIYDHNILVHTDDNKIIQCTGNLSAYEQQLSEISKLSGCEFIRPHKSYLVNCIFIDNVSTNEILLDSGINIPLSRYKAKDIKSQYLNYLRRN